MHLYASQGDEAGFTGGRIIEKERPVLCQQRGSPRDLKIGDKALKH